VIRWFPQTICDSLDQNCSVEAVDEKTGRTVGVAVNILTQKDLRNAGGTGEGRGLLEVLDPAQEPVMVEIAKFLGSLNQGGIASIMILTFKLMITHSYSLICSSHQCL